MKKQIRKNKGSLKQIDSTQQFFTTGDLAAAPWFPVNSSESVRRLITQGRLKALNVSVKPNQNPPKWQVPKDAVVEFLLNTGVLT
jgi:hypothetical protein